MTIPYLVILNDLRVSFNRLEDNWERGESLERDISHGMLREQETLERYLKTGVGAQ